MECVARCRPAPNLSDAFGHFIVHGQDGWCLQFSSLLLSVKQCGEFTMSSSQHVVCGTTQLAAAHQLPAALPLSHAWGCDPWSARIRSSDKGGEHNTATGSAICIVQHPLLVCVHAVAKLLCHRRFGVAHATHRENWRHLFEPAVAYRLLCKKQVGVSRLL
jgi:hypothetical protein